MDLSEISKDDTVQESVQQLQHCLENLKKLGLSEEEIEKLVEVVDAIIDNRLDALLH